jgi:uncharacterized lipoprotein YddW (UPF0748 family)
MRGVWLATVANRDWPSKPGLTATQQRAELITHLDRAVRNRLNTVIFQVRPTADALWPSPFEPWSQYLTGTQGKDPGWDPLGTAVEEAHARGLKLHAWFNPYRVAVHADPTRLAAGHPARSNPDWVVTYGGKLYYNPGLPEVRAFVQDAMLDAVKKYPVDGVHFDDYFYPYPVAGQSFDDDSAYDEYGAGFPDRAAWRRDNIDKLVRETADRIKRVRYQSFRRVAQRRHRLARLGHPGGRADLRRPARGHAQVGARELDRLHRPAAVLEHRLRRRRLREAGALVGGGRARLLDAALRGGGAVQGR